MTEKVDIKVGDYLAVTCKDGHRYTGVVIENLQGSFTCRVIDKDKGVGSGSWSRYGLTEGNGRLQQLSECEDVEVLASATKSEASSTLSLNESITNNKMTYYTTPLAEGKLITLCICEDHGGWSIHSEKDQDRALKESFFNARISEMSEDKKI